MTSTMELRCTLLSDGSSDQALVPILRWLLRQYIPLAINFQWAELRHLPKPPKSLPDRIRITLDLYPCDLLFVHRDAEGASYENRLSEIRQALRAATVTPPAVCVVPVRMREAWLLIDENAIRHAAGNPNGRQHLEMPPLAGLEELPDPKEILHSLLRQASGLQGRRLKKFLVHQHARLVAERIRDFCPLRELSAFRALEDHTRQTVIDQGWT